MKTVLLSVLAALVSASGVSAQLNLQAELQRQEQTAADTIAEYEAHLEQQQLRVQKLEALFARRHATWKEVAEQQMLVTQLQGRITSLNRMRGELARWSQSVRSTEDSKIMPDIVPVYDTRSSRVVGWIPSVSLEQSPETETTSSRAARPSVASDAFEGPVVTAEDDPRLLSLTLAGLRHEQSNRPLSSLELQIEYFRTHVERLRGLSHHRAFDQTELDAASGTLRQLEDQQQQLRMAGDSLPGAIRTLEQSAEELPAVNITEAGKTVVLDNGFGPYQLRLRFEQMLTEFQASDAAAELTFHRNYLSRLGEVVTASPSGTRELVSLELQTQLRESRMNEARQRLKWLAIEQQKLTTQSRLLSRSKESNEPERPAENYVVTALRNAASEGPPPWTYLETLSLASQQVVSNPYRDLDWARVGSIPLLNLDRSRMRLPRSRSTDTGTVPAKLSSMITIRNNSPGSQALHDAFQPRKLRFRAPYYEQYPFGNRRPQYRSRPGTPPWYLPGSPTNYR